MSPELFALLRLVARFAQRQALPREVLIEKRPDLLGLSATPATRQHARAVAMGGWEAGGAWTYAIHGAGCRMKHTVTGEPLDWAGPDLMRFDPYWFHAWLEWVIAHGEHAADASLVAPLLRGEPEERRLLAFELLGRLAAAGALRHHPGTTNMYELRAGER
jgi:hypothetical protein